MAFYVWDQLDGVSRNFCLPYRPSTIWPAKVKRPHRDWILRFRYSSKGNVGGSLCLVLYDEAVALSRMIH